MELYTLHLFVGAGGGILADLLEGNRPIGAVEIEEYPRSVLLSRQLEGSLPQFPIWDNVTTFRADNPATAGYIQRLRTISNNLCICGGFPCQDISAAGKGAGITGSRSGLWKEYARIVGEVRPRFVFAENSPFIRGRGLAIVLQDIAKMGYDAQWGCYSAAEIGAWHKRERFWLLAHTNATGREELLQSGRIETAHDTTERPSYDVSNADLSGNEWRIRGAGAYQSNERTNGGGTAINDSGERREAEPGLGRVVNGMAHWLDANKSGTWFREEPEGVERVTNDENYRARRLRAIGNGQVPQCALYAKRLLEEADDGVCNQETG